MYIESARKSMRFRKHGAEKAWQREEWEKKINKNLM